MLLPIELINMICIMKRDMEYVDETIKKRDKLNLYFKALVEDQESYAFHFNQNVTMMVFWFMERNLDLDITLEMLPVPMHDYSKNLIDFNIALGWVSANALDDKEKYG
jgi:hypothetical protein